MVSYYRYQSVGVADGYRDVLDLPFQIFVELSLRNVLLRPKKTRLRFTLANCRLSFLSVARGPGDARGRHTFLGKQRAFRRVQKLSVLSATSILLSYLFLLAPCFRFRLKVRASGSELPPLLSRFPFSLCRSRKGFSFLHTPLTLRDPLCGFSFPSRKKSWRSSFCPSVCSLSTGWEASCW